MRSDTFEGAKPFVEQEKDTFEGLNPCL